MKAFKKSIFVTEGSQKRLEMNHTIREKLRIKSAKSACLTIISLKIKLIVFLKTRANC